MSNSFLIMGNKYDADSALKEFLLKCGVDDIIKISDFSDIDALRSEICGSDIFSPKRVIIVNQIPQKVATELAPVLKRIPNSNIVVFVSYSSLKSSRKFCNHFKKKKSFYEFDLEVSDPSAIVRKKITENKKKASDDVISHFVNIVGFDIGIVLSEIDKLCVYVGTRTVIKEEDIDNVCCSSSNFVIWDFLNSLSSRNRKVSCRSLANAEECGINYEFLLAMLIRSLRLALFMREGDKRKVDHTVLKERIKSLKKKDSEVSVYNDYEIRKFAKNPKSFYNKFEFEELTRCLLECYNTELEIRKLYKSEDKRRAMMVLVIGVCVPSSFSIECHNEDIF